MKWEIKKKKKRKKLKNIILKCFFALYFPQGSWKLYFLKYSRTENTKVQNIKFFCGWYSISWVYWEQWISLMGHKTYYFLHVSNFYIFEYHHSLSAYFSGHCVFSLYPCHPNSQLTSKYFVSILNGISLSGVLIEISTFELTHDGFVVSCPFLGHEDLKNGKLEEFKTNLLVSLEIIFCCCEISRKNDLWKNGWLSIGSICISDSQHDCTLEMWLC